MSAITEVPTVNIVEARKYITRAFKKKRPVFCGDLQVLVSQNLYRILVTVKNLVRHWSLI